MAPWLRLRPSTGPLQLGRALGCAAGDASASRPNVNSHVSEVQGVKMLELVSGLVPGVKDKSSSSPLPL